MKKAVIYARVSSNKQAEEGLSIDAQLKQLRNYAADNGYEIVHEYIDAGESAKTADRPQFQNMISEIKFDPNNYDAVLIHKTDRFARNREDSIVYKSLLRRQCDVDVISITEDFGDGPVGSLVEGMLEVVAEFYSKNLANEVRKGQREKAAAGEALGEPPYGYMINEKTGKYEIYEPEAQVVRYIFNQYLKGEGSQAIADDIRKNGAKMFGEAVLEKKCGYSLSWKTNRLTMKIIKNEVYKGVFEWSDIRIEDNHPAIISKETFNLAQTLRKKRRGRGVGKKNMYLLKGLLECYECGSTLGRKRKTYKDGHIDYIHCIGHRVNKDCYSNRHRLDKIEKYLVKILEDIKNGESNIENLHFVSDNNRSRQIKLDKLKSKIKNFDEQFDRQMEAYEAGVINLPQLKKYKERLKQEKQEIKKEIIKLQQNPSQAIDKNKFKNRVTYVIKKLKSDASINEKRTSLISLVDKLRISKDKNLIEISYKW
ncbi:MAG: hypothetical protein AWU54_289 [Candidatus Frackibacter sp. T328-2]|nr:MAG: hypothetical protein AWU54_289 [Candidatus Frackibacter sp. T328-2]